MIFVTVGTQLPFDRLTMMLDEWQAEHPQREIIAQIGNTSYKPKHLKYYRQLEPKLFEEYFQQADFIVAHAGMGTILRCQEAGKRLVIMPREAKYGEHRTDHQIHTARTVQKHNYFKVAMDKTQLFEILDEPFQIKVSPPISPYAKPEFLSRLIKFFENSYTFQEPDGILCFGGEDWWYHNRGHYDIQMMQELSHYFPILYINSIGQRMPSSREGKIFLKRTGRKIKSFSKGLKKIQDNFWVLSPISTPGMRKKNWGRKLLLFQVKQRLNRLNIKNPLVWSALPEVWDLCHNLKKAAYFYQRTDKMEEFPGVDRKRLENTDHACKKECQVTLFCSQYLFQEEKQYCNHGVYLDHGVDYTKFMEANNKKDLFGDIAEIPHPRAVFVGGIDGHTFDSDFFSQVVKILPTVNFVIVGDCSIQNGWSKYRNVYLLGRKPYEHVPFYMASADILFMIWKRNEWINNCNPVKLKEYLAAGKGIITTPFPELARYTGYVEVANTPDDFSRKVQKILESPPDPRYLQSRVINETWESRGKQALKLIKELPFYG